MKKIIKILMLGIWFIILTWCSIEEFILNESLNWYWKNNNDYIHFQTDGSIEFLKWTWGTVSKIIEDITENKKLTYEVVETVIPHQMYLRTELSNKLIRIPFWIYKIEEDKLIFKYSNEIHKTIWVIDMWISRVELPTNFIGELDVWTKVKEIPNVTWIYYNEKYYETENVLKYILEFERNMAKQVLDQWGTKQDFLDILKQIKTNENTQINIISLNTTCSSIFSCFQIIKYFNMEEKNRIIKEEQKQLQSIFVN